MAPMPQLRIRNHTFVLTGRMWRDRGDIHAHIQRKGGRVSKVMRKGYILTTRCKRDWMPTCARRRSC